MNKHTTPTARNYAIAGAIITWFAVLLQLYLIIANRTMNIAATIVQFLSFFTILTNILVAIAYTNNAKQGTAGTSFFTRPSVLTAIAVYITVVGLIYNLVLRQLWSPQGWQRLADELLHSLNPILFLLFWLSFVPKQNLQWKNIFPWLIYPFIYCVYILIRGAIVHLYPYPFVDVNTLGYTATMINCGIVCLVFLFFCFLFVAIGKAITKFRG